MGVIDCGWLDRDRVNHCATVCPHGKGVLIAWYAAPREAHSTQRVYVVYWQEGVKHYEPVTMTEPGAGNPVLWAIDRNAAVLMYSRFEQLDCGNIIYRWRWCSNWLVTINNRNPRTGKRMPTTPEIGCLGRIQPIRYRDEWLLPMYREMDPCGIIMASRNGLDWTERGRIRERETHNGKYGKGVLMQPALWAWGNFISAICRDISRSKFAWYANSIDAGATWSTPTLDQLPNYNSSVTAWDDGRRVRFVWNTTPKRKVLMLGDVEYETQINTEKASYPNVCKDHEGRWHLVHTEERDGRKQIRHRIIDD